MGVDYFNCSICNEIICGCGYYYCCGNCGDIHCSDCHEEQVAKYGYVEEGSDGYTYYGGSATNNCDKCSGLVIYDNDIIKYLLNKTGLTKEEVICSIKKERDISD